MANLGQVRVGKRMGILKHKEAYLAGVSHGRLGFPRFWMICDPVGTLIEKVQKWEICHVGAGVKRAVIVGALEGSISVQMMYSNLFLLERMGERSLVVRWQPMMRMATKPNMPWQV